MAVSTGRARRTFRSTVLPWVVLAIGIVSSFALFAYFEQSVENVARLRFERETNDANGNIEERLRSYTDVLYALRALFTTKEQVDRLQFRRFIESLDLKQRYPGFLSLNYAAYVPRSEKDRFVESVRHDTSVNPDGYPNFAIKPSGDRDEYFVVVYLEPLTDYEFAFGLDLGANPMAADPTKVANAVRLQRDTGKLISSSQPLRMKRPQEPIFLAMRLAVYRNGSHMQTVEQRRSSYIGSVGIAFDVAYLMREALDDNILRHMQVRLYDAGPAPDYPRPDAAPQRRLLFDSAQLSSDRAGSDAFQASKSSFVYAVPVEVASRIWEFEYAADKSTVIGDTDRMLPRLVLASGIVSSLLLFGVLYSLASSRTRAERIANDMTKHLRDSEASLAEAHALLNDAQKLAGVGCCQYSLVDGGFIWSDELYRIHGVDARRFTPTYDAVARLIHPDDRSAWEETIAAALRNRETFTIEYRIVRPDGTLRYLRTLGEVLMDGTSRPTRMLWSVLDITEQKALEHTLRGSAEQLTALSRRLVDVQEAERRKLSRELHDRVGQNLTALSINLDLLRTSLDEEAHAVQRGRIEDSARLLERTADSIENVMTELRPPMLDDYGLLPALHWYAKDFSQRTGIHVHVTGAEPRNRPEPDIEITLFRVAQEALTNVAKHAHATLAEIALEQTDNQFTMTVTDNGIGIDATPVRRDNERPRLGMVTMRERAQAIGGRFEVRKGASGGTQIAITIS